jgi:transposase
VYIRQEILLSFEEIEKFSPPTKLELILSQIDLSKIMSKLESQDVRTGPRGYCKRAMLYAMVARIVEKIPTVKALCDRLRDDVRFRYNCGFDPYQPPPSQATFTRFMKQLEETGIADLLFQQQRDKAMELGFIQEENIAIGATHVEAYEKAYSGQNARKMMVLQVGLIHPVHLKSIIKQGTGNLTNMFMAIGFNCYFQLYVFIAVHGFELVVIQFDDIRFLIC